MLQAREARFKTFIGRGTVRSFRPGESFALRESLLDALDPSGEAGDDARFIVLGMTEAGINNLSGERIDAVTQRLATDLVCDNDRSGDEPLAPVRAPLHLPTEVLTFASTRGYGNAFSAQRA